MEEFLKIAELDENSKARIKQLEDSLGAHIMAYRSGLKIARLSDEQWKELKAAEEELDVILLAFDG